MSFKEVLMLTILDSKDNVPYRLGLDALRAGKSSSAEQFFLQAIAENPSFADAWCDLAHARCDGENLAGAMDALTAALNIDPEHPRARVMHRRVQSQIASELPKVGSYEVPPFQTDFEADALFRMVESYRPEAPNTRANMPIAAKRRFFVDELSWAIPTEEAISSINQFADNETILEIGAGKGLWAALIQKRGGVLIATDAESQNRKNKYTHRQGRYRNRAAFTFIERIDAHEAIRKYPCPVLMMCWPTIDSRAREDVLDLFEGNQLVFVGETPEENSTFSDRLTRDWTVEKQVAIPTWPGVFDALFLYRRKP